jgi:protein-S-isoprenylcysteine O-methyltransferase Ste14
MITKSTDVSVVAAQLTGWSLILLLCDMEVVITTIPLMAIVGAGLALVIISTLQLGNQSYSSLTRPRDTNVFVRRFFNDSATTEIYTGMLIVGLAFLLSRPTLNIGVAYLLLALVTNVRAGIEEMMLAQRYPEYVEYRKQTKRYVPFVY